MAHQLIDHCSLVVINHNDDDYRMQLLCDASVLTQIPAFQTLPERSRAAVASTMEVIAIGRTTPLTLRVPPTTHYIVPLTANLTLHRVASSTAFGMRLPQGVLWPITLAAGSVMEVRCRQKGLVGLLSADHINTLMRTDANVRLVMLQAVLASHEHITLEIEQYTANTLTGRVAHLLLQLSADPENNTNRTVFYGHAQLAELINARRESVSIVIGRFRAAGWIKTAYSRIQLLDIPALENIATQF